VSTRVTACPGTEGEAPREGVLLRSGASPRPLCCSMGVPFAATAAAAPCAAAACGPAPMAGVPGCTREAPVALMRELSSSFEEKGPGRGSR
jgi:hypothetical protein